jgi:hypothetical protein
MSSQTDPSSALRRRSWFADARRAAGAPEVVVFRPILSAEGVSSILAIPVLQPALETATLGATEEFSLSGSSRLAETQLWSECLRWVEDRPLIADSLPARLPILEASLERAALTADDPIAGRLRADDRPLVDLHETADALARRGVLRGAERAQELGLRGLSGVLSPSIALTDHQSSAQATARIWSELLLPGLKTWAGQTSGVFDEHEVLGAPIKGTMTHLLVDGTVIEQPIADLYVEAGYDEIGLPSIRIIAIPLRFAQNASIAEVMLSPGSSAELSALLRSGSCDVGETESNATFVHDPYDGADARVMRNRRLVLDRAPGARERLSITHQAADDHERISLSLGADQRGLTSLAARIDRARRALLD